MYHETPYVELTPFFQPEGINEKPKPDTPEEALNEAQQYAFSRLITREYVERRGRNSSIPDLSTLTIEATAHRCTQASFRMIYHLWKNARHLFQNMFLFQAERGKTQPSFFTGFSESTIYTSVVAQDMEGRWYFISPANHDGSISTYLKTRIDASSLEELIAEVEKSEISVGKGGEERLFPSAEEVKDCFSNQNLLHQPELDSIDFSQETEIRNEGQWLTNNVKYVPLDTWEFGLLDVEANRAQCSVLQIPIIERRTASHTVFDPPKTRTFVQKMVIPKEE